MTEAQRRKQFGAICAQYKKMIGDGVLPPLADDVDDSRRLWATQVCGRLIPSLKVCADCELNLLRDTLNGKQSKVHARLRDVLTETKKNPDAWVNSMMHTAPRYMRYRDPATRYTVETVPWIEAYRMLMQEEVRAGRAGYRKPNWKPIQQNSPAPRAQVSSENRMLWGM